VSAFIASKGVKHTISTAYHPEGQGVTERANRTILKALRAAVGKRFADWGQHVPAVQWHLNTTLNTSVGCAPFTAFFGREPPTELSTSMGKPHDLFRGVDDYMTLVREWQDYVNRVQQQAYLRAKAAHDATHCFVAFEPGDRVLLYKEKLENKLDSHYNAAYVVVARVHGNRYKLRAVNSVRVDDFVEAHVDRMLRYDASRTTDREAIEAQVPQGYGIVDSVLEHKQEDDGLSFFIRWKGCDASLDSWLPARDLKRVAVVRSYCALHGLSLKQPQRKRSGTLPQAADDLPSPAATPAAPAPTPPSPAPQEGTAAPSMPAASRAERAARRTSAAASGPREARAADRHSPSPADPRAARAARRAASTRGR